MIIFQDQHLDCDHLFKISNALQLNPACFALDYLCEEIDYYRVWYFISFHYHSKNQVSNYTYLQTREYFAMTKFLARTQKMMMKFHCISL